MAVDMEQWKRDAMKAFEEKPIGGRLEGKVAIVTGCAGATSMGRAIVFAYLREGAKVLGADIYMEGLEETDKRAKELGYGDRFSYVKCDISSDEDCDNAVKRCVELFGTYNVLSQNAGVGDNFTMVDEMDNALWDRQLRINLTGPMKICRSSLRYFLDNKIKASIIMITSNAAFESCTGGPSYVAAKAGANALMKAIAFEYAREGIRCNSICPGPVLTELSKGMGQRSSRGDVVHHAGYNGHYAEWTIKRFGLAEDIAPAAVYLASDESAFTNSASLIIDGGVCLG